MLPSILRGQNSKVEDCAVDQRDGQAMALDPQGTFHGLRYSLDYIWGGEVILIVFRYSNITYQLSRVI